MMNFCPEHPRAASPFHHFEARPPRHQMSDARPSFNLGLPEHARTCVTFGQILIARNVLLKSCKEACERYLVFEVLGCLGMQAKIPQKIPFLQYQSNGNFMMPRNMLLQNSKTHVQKPFLVSNGNTPFFQKKTQNLGMVKLYDTLEARTSGCLQCPSILSAQRAGFTHCPCFTASGAM